MFPESKPIIKKNTVILEVHDSALPTPKHHAYSGFFALLVRRLRARAYEQVMETPVCLMIYRIGPGSCHARLTDAWVMGPGPGFGGVQMHLTFFGCLFVTLYASLYL